MENVGKIIVGTGIVLVIVGLFVWLFADKLGWFGNLPGGLKIERPPIQPLYTNHNYAAN